MSASLSVNSEALSVPTISRKHCSFSNAVTRWHRAHQRHLRTSTLNHDRDSEPNHRPSVPPPSQSPLASSCATVKRGFHPDVRVLLSEGHISSCVVLVEALRRIGGMLCRGRNVSLVTLSRPLLCGGSGDGSRSGR